MTGANRPLWVDIQDFFRMPFNYCDRWCEKCRLTNECRVFKNEEESKKEWIKAGKDPDSMEYVFDTVGKSFKKVRELIGKDAKRFGINLDEIDCSQDEKEPEPETFEIYQLALKFSKAGRKILSDLQVVTEDVDENLLISNAEIISHYNLAIPAKVYRAILSREEEKKDPDIIESCPDARNSGFLLVNWINEIIASLNVLMNHPPLRPTREKLAKFKKVAVNLRDIINIEFEVEEKERLN